MKTMTLIICTMLLVTSYSLAGAVVYTGAMENRTGFPFIAGFTGQSRAWTTGGNANAGGNGTDGLRLEWQADNETTPGSWTYTYRVLRGTSRNHGFAYFDIETASDFTAADVLSFQPVSATDISGAPLGNLATIISLSNPVNFTAVHDYSNAAVTEANVTTALNKTELSHYSGDPGIAPAGQPGLLASDTPTAGPIAHPFFGLRVTFPGIDVPTFNVKAWEFRLVSKRAPMWGSFFGWGGQTSTTPFWYANFHNNNIDNPSRLSLAPATSLTGAPPYQGWILVPGPLPTVISTTPAGGAANVPGTDPVTAVFGGDIDPVTITPVTFNLGGGRNGTVSYDPATKTATFTPTLPLPGNAAITATILGGAAGVKDLAGNALAADKVWSFTTALVDTVAPTVVATIPSDGSIFVPVTAALTATFSEEIDPATLTATSFTVAGITGTTSYNAATRTATFTPSAPLANNTSYTATITTGVKDVAGNVMAAAKTWSFTTIPVETILPAVAATVPNDATFDVPVTRPITATFSEAMDPATINTANFSIAGVTGTVSYDAATNTAALTPDATLALATNYVATITTGVKDLAGNALPKPKVWSFTTSPTPPAALPDGILITGETQATIQDAVKILRLVLNLDQATQNDLNHGDVAPLGPDGKPQPDGKINISDAVVILRKAVGLVSW